MPHSAITCRLTLTSPRLPQQTYRIINLQLCSTVRSEGTQDMFV